jgi:iron complex outermembrane receptor protein
VRHRRKLAALILSIGLNLAQAPAQQTNAAADLSGTSLEDLTRMDLRVSSFARKDQDLWVTPAAVFVITREDIERSAASSIPELLRIVPGIQVAQITASSWAVSARGFNSAYANKLLVLIDGRTVYSEIYSGAHWDQDDLPLEDIERIEVIRGPGAAVWGTNAVNGVINIITKRARSTQGMNASAGISRIDDLARVEYGGSLGDRLQYRGYAFYRDREALEMPNGQDQFDGEDSLRGGGRLDWQRNSQNWLTMSGDIYGGHLKQLLRPEFAVPVGPLGQDTGSIAGRYLLGRWERKQPHANSALQFYFDDTSRHELAAYNRSRTFDTDYQDHRAAGERNDFVWGAGLRLTANHIADHDSLTTMPEYNNYLIDSFFQDEVALKPQHLTLTVGTKVEQGRLSGFQVEPSVRILWSPSRNESWWAAVSRAAVSPSIQDKSTTVPLNLGTADGLPVSGELLGNPGIKPETVVAYEAGYRQRLASNLTLDTATFFNVNHRLQTVSASDPVLVLVPQPHFFTTLLYGNGFRANTAGVELAASWKPAKALLLAGGYTWMQAQLVQTQPGEVGLYDTWSTPQNAYTGSLSWRFARTWSLDTLAAHTGSLPAGFALASSSFSDQVPAFTRLDLRLKRKVGRFMELEAGGTNLLAPRHVEFGSQSAAIIPAYTPRSFTVTARWAY